jgi:hypothetical protein
MPMGAVLLQNRTEIQLLASWNPRQSVARHSDTTIRLEHRQPATDRRHGGWFGSTGLAAASKH